MAAPAGSLIIARDGGWKLSGFEFVSSSADGFSGSSTPQLAFEYTSAHPSPWEEYSHVRPQHSTAQPWLCPFLAGFRRGIIFASTTRLSPKLIRDTQVQHLKEGFGEALCQLVCTLSSSQGSPAARAVVHA